MKRKQTRSSDSSKAAKRVLRTNTTLEIDIAEKERKMSIAVGLVSAFGMPPKELRFHLKQCIGVSLIAKYVGTILYFGANKRVDAGGSCLNCVATLITITDVPY